MPSKPTSPRRDRRKHGKPKEKSPRHSSQRISTGRADMQQDETKLTCNGRNDVGMKENKNRGSRANTQHPEYSQLVPNHYKKSGPTVKGFRRCGLVEGGQEPIFGFQPRPLLGKCFAGMTFCLKGVCGHNEKCWSHHLVIWSRNHEYSFLLRKEH